MMRLYSFVNSYLSPMQAGIQTAHMITNMMLNRFDGDAQVKGVVDMWAGRDKTIIILDGGDDTDMRDRWEQMTVLFKGHHVPYAYFVESGLGNTLTCVGVICRGRPKDDHVVGQVLESSKLFRGC